MSPPADPPPRRELNRTDVAKALALPPAGLFWALGLGFALLATGSWSAGAAVLALATAALYLLCLPPVAAALLARLDRFPPFEAKRLEGHRPTALVVLDAGRRHGASEYGDDGLKPMTLERLAYAAWLWRRLGLPIAVTGNGAGPLMTTYTDRLFDVPVRWVEPTSHNTRDNAVRTAELLRGHEIERIVLVTHYWHMPRAAAVFAAAGMEVVPAPMGFARGRDLWEKGPLAFVPSATALARSHLAIHEAVGLLWYRWRYSVGRDPVRPARPKSRS